MAGTKKKSEPISIGRILDYQVASPEEKVLDFKKRLEEQIAVIRVGIKSGDVNDSQKAQNYIKKIEKFLAIDFFSNKKNNVKRVRHLKQECKVVVATNKEIIDIIKKWISQKRNYKITAAEEFVKGEAKQFDFMGEMKGFYDRDNSFLRDIEANYNSELILLNRIKGMLADKTITSALGVKNSWKVETLKESLLEWSQDYPINVEIELEEIFKLPYFRYKKYLTLEVSEFKDFLDVRTKALQEIVDWIEEYISYNNSEFEVLKSQMGEVCRATEYDLLDEYDRCLDDLSRVLQEYEKEYRLYRFGQGLMEADIFDTLYK